jgi:hypothetical protein
MSCQTAILQEVIGNAVHVMGIATGRAEEDCGTPRKARQGAMTSTLPEGPWMVLIVIELIAEASGLTR